MKIAFIGIGVMGRPMSENIRKAGHEVCAYVRSAAKAEELKANGYVLANSPRECASGADVVITMLPSSPDVELVALGKDGIIEGMRKDAVYVEMSTINPTVSKQVAAAFAERGLDMLDSPVTRGVTAARDGTLALYVGGKAEVLEKVRPVLECMATTILHMGANGAGHATKLCNNMLTASIALATSEMFVYGAKHGLDMEKLFEAVENGSGASRALKVAVRDLGLARKFDKLTFPAGYMRKDVDLCLEDAKSMGLPMFFPSLSHNLLTMLMASGGGKCNFAEAITVFEKFAGVEARIDKKQ